MTLLLVALLIVAFVLLGAFVIKWLFIVAVVVALVWLISFFSRGAGRNLGA